MTDRADIPEDIDPYATLALSSDASAADIKKAYRKLALRHHPDKVPSSEKEGAHTKFQEIAFAYAILSDERRRKRYDTTGNTSDSLDLEDDDFNWSDFFRAQWNETVTESRVADFKKAYQHSEQEKKDILAAYTQVKGRMNRLYEEVMLSNPLEDEQRFRIIIDAAITDAVVENYEAYTSESEASRKKRMRKAQAEAKEAEELLKDIKETKGKKGKGHVAKAGPDASGDLGDLAALIQQRQQSRAAGFLSGLEAKYATHQNGKGGAGAGKRKQKMDEPSEAAFEAMGKRIGKKRK